MLQEALDFAKANQDNLDFLKDLIRIPTISAQPQYAADMVKCADFIAQEMRRIGLNQVEVVPGLKGEHPLVKGEWLEAKDKPTILMYAHYDVQPVDPLDLWLTPPFDPQVRDGKLYGRGASDDKASVRTILFAIESYLKTSGKLPVNVKVLFEGEEEYVGTHIRRYIESKPPFLQGLKAALMLDGALLNPNIPSINMARRGLIHTHLSVRTLKVDAHSGVVGGVAPNAAEALAHIFAGLKTKQGHVRIPGFYKKIIKPSKQERAGWKGLPVEERHYLAQTGAKELIGNKRIPPVDRVWNRPTLDVAGISSGYTDSGGFKGIIPATAQARVSMRLAVGMDAKETADAFIARVKEVTPSWATCDVTILMAVRGFQVDYKDAEVQKFALAMEEAFGTPTRLVRSGATVPCCDAIKFSLGVPMISTGFGIPGANTHAPNENLDLATHQRGNKAVIRYLDIVGR